MTIERSVYGTEDLLGVMRELDEVPVFWRRWFPTLFFSDRQKIEWSKIPSRRRLAPLVLPTIPGQPVFGTEEDLFSVMPAYIKPKDAVDAAAMLPRRAGFGELGQLQPMTPGERYNATIAAILEEHRRTIERRWEWMAAMALINAQITLVDDAYPTVTINFRRNANQTVTLAGSSTWNTAGLDLPSQVDSWIFRMNKARFGAAGRDLIMGLDAWDSMRGNASVLKLLDTQVRGTVANIDIGIGDGTPYQFRGTLGRNLNLWTYQDYYEAPDGTEMNYLGAKEAILLAPPAAVAGVRAYGAILDKAAGLQPLAMFPKMWDSEDPSATIVMTQSAPIMVPVNPNATMKVVVLQ